MKTILHILIIFILTMLSQDIEACSCIEERTVEDELSTTDIVFVGTIIKSEEIKVNYHLDTNFYRTEMRYECIVSSLYKGNLINDTVFIFTGSGGGDCGYNFKLGQKYIVYARHHNIDKRHNGYVFIDKKSVFYTTICTRTRAYNLKEIREIEKHVDRQIPKKRK